MNVTSRQKLILAVVASLVVVLGAVSLALTLGDDDVIEATADDATSTAAASAESTDTSSGDVPSDEVPGDEADTGGVTTTVDVSAGDETVDSSDTTELDDETAESTSTTTAGGDAAFDTTGLVGEPVVSFPGNVSIVRYAEDQDEVDCAAGTLVAEKSGEIVAVYDLPFAGGVSAYRPDDGPTMLVGNCEESTTFIQIIGDAVDASGAPIFQAIGIPTDVFFMDDFGFESAVGLFGARAAYLSPERAERVVFDPTTGQIVSVLNRVGARFRLPIAGADMIVPTDWELFYEDDTLAEFATSSGTLFSVFSFPADGPEEIFEVFDGETLERSVSDEITIWSGNSDAARPSAVGDVNEAFFSGPEGERYVRSIHFEGRTVEIEAFLPAAAPESERAIAEWMVELVRVFDTIG